MKPIYLLFLSKCCLFLFLESEGGFVKNPYTVNPLYNGICYNNKIRYNVKFGLHKNQPIVYFFIDSPVLFFRKTNSLKIC